MCGGSALAGAEVTALLGLSPRVRGKLKRNGLEYLHSGSIPACAGEALLYQGGGVMLQVYPRVCGGSGRAAPVSQPCPGLSPRVRGKQWWAVSGGWWAGSIPACAGEAPGRAGRRNGQGVYPRVCGGSVTRPVVHIAQEGLSPRVRGKPKRILTNLQNPGSIPACAGEAVRCRVPSGLWRVYPRVCGGSPVRVEDHGLIQGLSPRVRGKRPGFRICVAGYRSIPACAGEARCW